MRLSLTICLHLVSLVSIAGFHRPAFYSEAEQAVAAYRIPPKPVMAAIERSLTASTEISPDGRYLAIIGRRRLLPLSELARPTLDIAGVRLDISASVAMPLAGITSLSIADTASLKTVHVALPIARGYIPIGFSPSGVLFAFAAIGDTGGYLWVADSTNGNVHQVSNLSVNLVYGTGCEWLRDNRALVCRIRVHEPDRSSRAWTVGPAIQSAEGRGEPQRLFQGLLSSPSDDRRFERAFLSQLVQISVVGGRVHRIGPPGIYLRVDVSPDNNYLLIERAALPYSRDVPVNGFQREVQVWERKGHAVRSLGTIGSQAGLLPGSVPLGRREFRWVPSTPVSLSWVETLDEGLALSTSEWRDSIRVALPPFDKPTEISRTRYRTVEARWTESASLVIREFDWSSRRDRWLRLLRAGKQATLAERHFEDRSSDPGMPVTTPGTGFAVEHHGLVLFAGTRQTAGQLTPFISGFDESGAKAHEIELPGFSAVLGYSPTRGGVVLRQDSTKATSYVLRAIEDGSSTRTIVQTPTSGEHWSAQVLRYTRTDGTDLTGTLYLPSERFGSKIPVLVWVYPQVFSHSSYAARSTNDQTAGIMLDPSSPIALTSAGYAVLLNPSMPIINGSGSAVSQLVENAAAALKALSNIEGVDASKAVVGGHSFGAAAAALLLAHSDLFVAGIGRSGAYNRTLTPFGYQTETRTLWKAPDSYIEDSPIFVADKINEPFLLIHGEKDENSSTYHFQSERMFRALSGLRRRARFVSLPYEGHEYRALESVRHIMVEMADWMSLSAAPPK